VVQRAEIIKPFVREQILLAIAVIVKGGWMDEKSSKMTLIFESVTKLLTFGTSQKLIAVALLLSIVREFSSSKASAVGFTWEYHFKCRRTFEEKELPSIFSIAIELLKSLLSLNSLSAEEFVSLFAAALGLVEQILNWEFAYYDLGKLSGYFKKAETGEASENLVFQPPKSWQPFIINQAFLPMFFQIHIGLSRFPRLSSHTRQCLVQLATMTGQIFPNDEAKVSYCSQFLEGLLTIMNNFSNCEEKGPEMHTLSLTIKNLIYNFGLSMLLRVPQFGPFLMKAAELTFFCLKSTPNEVDETWFMDSFDLLLLTWSYMVNRSAGTISETHPDFIKMLKEISSNIFMGYIEARNVTKLEDLEDDDQEDQNTYEDQLIAIGTLGRHNAGFSLGVLTRFVAEMTENFKQLLAFASTNRVNEKESGALFERIHWMLLLCGNVLADSGFGEKPTVPDPLFALSSISPFENDPIIVLSNSLINFFGLMCLEPNDPKLSVCSPLVIETFLWFLNRWVQTYLMPDTRDSSSCSENLLMAYGADVIGAKGLIEFLLQKLLLIFACWMHHQTVLNQLVKLLDTFSQQMNIRAAILESKLWYVFMMKVIENLMKLPSEVQSDLVQSLCRMASGASQQETQASLLSLLTNVAEGRLQSLLQRPDFLKIHQKAETIAQINVSIEMFRGVAMGTDASNFEGIFSFCSTYFDSFVKLFEIYCDNAEVINVIVNFYNHFIEHQLPYLNNSQCEKLYQSTIALFRVYSAKNLGKKKSSKIAEEEQHEDILLMLKIMSNLISKDFLDFSDQDGFSVEVYIRPDPSQTQVSDVVFYGLNIIIPLITLELLQFPDLCLQYFKLSVFMVEIYPEKLRHLPPELFQSLMRSLQFGIDHVSSEVSKLTFEALSGLASHCYIDNTKSKDPNKERELQEFLGALGQTIDSFLDIILRYMLFKDFHNDLMEPASEALFALICVRHSSYQQIAQNIINQVSPEISQRRLSEAFGILLNSNDLQPTLDRKNNARFKENLEKFLVNVRGFLRFK